MVSPGFPLPPALIASLFPFHLAFGREMKVVQVGQVLQRICPGLSAGSRLNHHFRITRPSVQVEFDPIREHARSVFLLESLHSALQLKGQMVYVEEPEVMLFLCSPWLNDVTALGQLGLALEDFATHDPTADFLFLLQAQNTALADARKLTNKLLDQRAELRKAAVESRTLYEIGQEITAQVALEPTLKLIVDHARDLLRAEICLLALRQNSSDTFGIQASSGTVPKALAEVQVRPGEGLTGRFFETAAPMIVNDYLQEYRESPFLGAMEEAGIRSVVAVPLKARGAVIGILAVTSQAPGKFREEDRQLLSALADQAAIAIENARLFEQVRQHAEALEAKVRERTRQLEGANLKLEAASHHKSRFLANMSHELRTPLNAILGYTELILDNIYGQVSEKVREVLERLDKSGRHLLGLINDVLDLSKIEAGQLTLALSDYSLKEVVQTVVIAVEALAAEKKLALKFELSPDLPAGRGDERRITQVLLNLVGNAIKFTEVGEVRVQAALASGAFLVSVSDSGPGIAPADQEKIFEEFQQAESSGTQRSGGTGLGLSITKRIIELHGGRIWVESTPGRGSTFWFTLPVRAERRTEVT